jgi:peptidoglycan LD-endopeptidase CwlK
MLTIISLARLANVHPLLRTRIIQLDALIPSVSLQVTQGLRTWPEQDALWQQGRTTPGPRVTDAPAGYSAHNFGYAVDVVPEDIIPGQPDWNISHPAWQKILAAAPSVGLAEGAQWRTYPDNPHLYLQELPAEPTDAMRAQFTDGGLMEVWKAFDLG